MNARKQVVSTPQAFVSKSPLTQAIKAGGLLYVSGQLPYDATARDFVRGDIQAQTDQVLKNLKAIVEAGGTDLSAVVKVTVYLTNMAWFESMNEVYRRYFPTEPPARTCIGAKELPRGVDVEMDLIALAN